MKHTVFVLAAGIGLCLSARAAEQNNFVLDSVGQTPRAVSETTLPPPPPDAPYRNPSLDVERRIDDLLPRLTEDEKIRMLHSPLGNTLGGVPRLGLSEFRLLDGGCCGPRDALRRGITAFPCGVAVAATWNRALAREIGRAEAIELRALHKDGVPGRMMLGPGCNLTRSPFGARSFEYMGEDPFLTGTMASAYGLGLQDRHVSAVFKHFVCNDQEWCRTVIDVTCGARALREIYARPFLIGARSGIWCIMNSYNAVNGAWTSWNRPVNDILLREAGWDGAIIPDACGYRNDERAIAGGTSIHTFDKVDMRALIARERAMLADGRIRRDDFEQALRRALRFYFRVGAFDAETPAGKAEQKFCEDNFRSAAIRDLAYRAAAESCVLLENRDGFLPRDLRRVRSIAVVGPNADQYHTCHDGGDISIRGGSAAVNAAREYTPLAGFCELFGAVRVRFAPGFRFEATNAVRALSVAGKPAEDVLRVAAESDLVVFCGGYDHHVDREVFGWGHLDNMERRYLTFKPGPNGESQEDLIVRIAAVNPNIVLALNAGAPFTTEKVRRHVKAIFCTWYPGEFGGRVLADLVFGLVEPCGRLPFTCGYRIGDWPCMRLGERSYPGIDRRKPLGQITDRDCTARQTYLDGIWVGYRGFDHFGTKPLYPFGHGLSYTSFELSKADGNAVRVRNTGARRGRAVVQCYLTKPSVPDVEMPVKELCDFATADLEPGAETVLRFSIGDEPRRYWDARAQRWVVPKGRFRFAAGFSSADLPVHWEE